MRLKKEVVVLLGAVAVLALLFWNRREAQIGRNRTARAGEPPVFLDLPAPDASLVAAEDREPASWDRDPFTMPSATRPLPPLAFEEPPLEPLEGLLPPPSLGPRTALFGSFLRRPATVRPVRGLFVSAEDATDEEEDDFGSGPNGVLDERTLTALNALGYGTAPEPERLSDLTSAEREERIASWRRLYDWIRVNEIEVLYGSIQNEDPYGLTKRTDEPIQFLEVDPQSGRERFPAQGPVPYPRARVIDYQFADTVAHQIGQWRYAIGNTVTPGQFPEVLEFGHYCVKQRLEAPAALATAEEVFKLLIATFPDDPAPRLGLAGAYEAGFRLEEAYAEYLALLDEFGHRAEVHVALGELEAKLRLFNSAAARFAEAERLERTNWRVQQALARFHAERDDWPRALEHAELAHRFEPVATYREERSAIRNDLGTARLAAGDPEGAREIFRQVLAVDKANQLALAGLHAAYVLDEGLTVGDAHELSEDQFGFELLVGLAVESMVYGSLDVEEASRARTALETAVEIDPVRAWQAWRALSWLAEVTGYPEEAFQYAEFAHEANPTDAWTLYQRGRLLAGRDDPEGAVESFQDALAQEADFADALVGLANLAYERGDHDAAERYFERALLLEPARAKVHARRGINYLALNELGLARSAFEAALAVAPEDPVARTGLAWCAYRGGDPERARQAYAEVDDLRRTQGEEDVYRLYARYQMESLEEHLSKVQWTDRFERRLLRNGWHPDELESPTISLVDGRLVVRGTFSRDGRVRAFRTLAAPSFVSLEATMIVNAPNNARVGIFVAKERQVRGGGSEATSEIAVGRHRDGPVQVKVRENSSAENAWIDLAFPEWPIGVPVRVRIEREGEGSATTGRILVDDFTVVEGAALRSLFASTSDLRFGIFVDGNSGRQADLEVDVVDVVHTIR